MVSGLGPDGGPSHPKPKPKPKPAPKTKPKPKSSSSDYPPAAPPGSVPPGAYGGTNPTKPQGKYKPPKWLYDAYVQGHDLSSYASDLVDKWEFQGQYNGTIDPSFNVANSKREAALAAIKQKKKETGSTTTTTTTKTTTTGGTSGGGTAGGGTAPKTPAKTTPSSTVGTPPGTGTPTKPTPPPSTYKDIVIPDASLDPIYIQQLAEYKKQLASAQTAENMAKSDYNANYQDTLRNIGWNQARKAWMTNDPTTQYGSAAQGISQQFSEAGGGPGSGVYDRALQNMSNTFTRQYGQMANQQQRFNSAQDLQYQNQYDANTAARIQAMMNARERIAAQYGVNYNQVPQTGGSKTVRVPLSQSTTA